MVALAALNEACQAADIHLFRVDSNVNVADFFTKGLGGEKHTRFGSQSLGKNITYLYKCRKNMITTDDEQVVQLTNNGVGDSLTDDNDEMLQDQDGVVEYHSLTRMADEQLSEEGEQAPDQDGVVGYHSLTKMADEQPSKEGERIDNRCNSKVREIESDKQAESNLLNENMIKIEKYLQKAAHYAELGHEPKFHMSLKLAKFLGHIPKSMVNK